MPSWLAILEVEAEDAIEADQNPCILRQRTPSERLAMYQCAIWIQLRYGRPVTLRSDINFRSRMTVQLSRSRCRFSGRARLAMIVMYCALERNTQREAVENKCCGKLLHLSSRSSLRLTHRGQLRNSTRGLGHQTTNMTDWHNHRLIVSWH